METVHFMQNDPRKRPAARQNKPRLRLPFEKRKMDFGTWSYVHRAGLSITVIAFLVFGIAFVSCRISMRTATVATALYLDFERKEAEPQKPEVREEVQSYDYSDVANRASNENASLNANLRDAQGNTASDLYNEAGRLDGQMRANREAFEQGLNQVDQMRNSQGRTDTGGEERRQDAKVDGTVTVSYAFSNPVRNSEVLIVPAYMCQGGGTVVVEAALDRNGYVTSATVDRARSTTDECMRSTAVKAALGSRFNLDVNAPQKHKGTITYVFIPQ